MVLPHGALRVSLKIFAHTHKFWTCYELRFEVLTAVGMKMAVFWVVAPCSLVVY
jgi:hypothetical protein